MGSRSNTKSRKSISLTKGSAVKRILYAMHLLGIQTLSAMNIEPSRLLQLPEPVKMCRVLIKDIQSKPKTWFSMWDSRRTQDDNYNTILHAAAYSESGEIIKNHYATYLYWSNKQGITPVIVAICAGNSAAEKQFYDIDPYLKDKAVLGFMPAEWSLIAEAERKMKDKSFYSEKDEYDYFLKIFGALIFNPSLK